MNSTVTFNSAPVAAEGKMQADAALGSAGWSVIRSTIIGAVSFGIVPAFVWPGRFREIIDSESQRFHDAADWAAGIDPSPRAVAALKSVESIRPNGLLTILPKLLALFTAVALGMQFFDGTFSLDELSGYTYSFAERWTNVRSNLGYHAHAIHAIWGAALSFAYAAHWIQVSLHRDAVHRFVKQFNRVIEPRGVLPVCMREPKASWPLLVIGSIVFAQYGAWWGIPLLLAASAQSRYTLVTSRSLAVQFDDRLSKAALQRTVERRCTGEGCRALLPLPAKFCPQCGRRVPEPMIDQVG